MPGLVLGYVPFVDLLGKGSRGECASLEACGRGASVKRFVSESSVKSVRFGLWDPNKTFGK